MSQRTARGTEVERSWWEMPRSGTIAPLMTEAPFPRRRLAIEEDFPFAAVSEVAEVESWRKEIYRPVYHLHKWWAQRLGTVFRAALLGAASPVGTPLMERFYEPIRLPAPVVFDPFMGSGTTIGEAHKLGCTAIGRDINPVAWRSVVVALSPLSKRRLEETFRKLEESVGRKLRELYRASDSRGEVCDVLYFFWVKHLPCPACGEAVDLFSSRIFARHAYVRRNPRVQVVCPDCGDVFAALHTDTQARCPSCSTRFDPHEGAVSRTQATCAGCGEGFRVARTARGLGRPPEHRLYAKLVLREDGKKEYLPATDADRAAYLAAEEALRSEAPPLPRVPIRDGYNTRQVLGYGYRTWDEMFNARQLLALTRLAGALRDLDDSPETEALRLLFSGALEFNNLFTSYKGEGTGAVRHMFSHHVLKPERTPIEANVWGTPKSSGAFSTLFRSRLLRALDYKEAPFEVAYAHTGRGRKKGHKVFGLSSHMAAQVLDRWPEGGLPAGAVYLSCGDSAATDLPDASVDLVVTDPPFFDNVHYSELADFFHVWQRLYFGDGASEADSTRRPEEVQDTDASAFAEKLRSVFLECFRVLRDDGLLVFSYHHSRDDGWNALVHAVLGAGFTVVQAHPVKAEMSGATPKNQARSPIDLDVLIVCRKRQVVDKSVAEPHEALNIAVEETRRKVRRFNAQGRSLSESDVRVVLLSQLLSELSPGRGEDDTREAFSKILEATPDAVRELWNDQQPKTRPVSEEQAVQLPLLRS